MLQKLENIYLAILRFVVILVAGLLLATVAVLGLSSFSSLQSEPSEKAILPAVSDESLKNLVLGKEAVRPQPSTSTGESAQMIDPNQAFYERTAESIVAFVTKESGGSEKPTKSQVAEITKDRAEKYDAPEIRTAYARGFAETVERLLKDPELVAAAKETSPIELVNRLLNTFALQFEQQINATESQNRATQQAFLERKVEGQQRLYIAGGAFAAFLMIVFLSIIIRIERNLRHLERAAA